MSHLSPPLVMTVRRGPDAERRLFRAYHDGGDPRARDALTTRFMPLARSVARRYRGSTVPLEDLEQIAYMTLVRAIDRFDHRRGTAFSSYVVPCISGELKRHYRDHGWSVRVPRELQELALRVESATSSRSRPAVRPPPLRSLSHWARASSGCWRHARRSGPCTPTRSTGPSAGPTAMTAR